MGQDRAGGDGRTAGAGRESDQRTGACADRAVPHERHRRGPSTCATSGSSSKRAESRSSWRRQPDRRAGRGPGDRRRVGQWQDDDRARRGSDSHGPASVSIGGEIAVVFGRDLRATARRARLRLRARPGSCRTCPRSRPRRSIHPSAWATGWVRSCGRTSLRARPTVRPPSSRSSSASVCPRRRRSAGATSTSSPAARPSESPSPRHSSDGLRSSSSTSPRRASTSSPRRQSSRRSAGCSGERRRHGLRLARSQRGGLRGRPHRGHVRGAIVEAGATPDILRARATRTRSA